MEIFSFGTPFKIQEHISLLGVANNDLNNFVLPLPKKTE